jgi:2-C-methyl-D-erythritol 2,4-cyclodiphosphate synthase
MRRNIAEALGIVPAQISIKATTSEKLGFVGRKEGATAFAVVLLNSDNVTQTAPSGKN